MTLRAEPLSSPEVGSSRMSTAGSWRRLRPMETRRRSPPERPPEVVGWSLVWAAWRRERSSSKEETELEMAWGEMFGLKVQEHAKCTAMTPMPMTDLLKGNSNYGTK
ncbi:alpha-N-arabinofuranosidase C [Striga asiatica]|uniref:Alpha-N-arabinofuranosidase C n=1 Tax=Striga asiatica TaxID=4170 RepID=A0A5A7PPF1_STRAF|nr:alpha-N-arabinofuranosidase C [Striga asiatica]